LEFTPSALLCARDDVFYHRRRHRLRSRFLLLLVLPLLVLLLPFLGVAEAEVLVPLAERALLVSRDSPRFFATFAPSETTLGEDTKDPTTHWDSERIGREN